MAWGDYLRRAGMMDYAIFQGITGLGLIYGKKYA